MLPTKILIVDDEKSQREMIAGFLNKKGFKTATAESGEKAIEIYPAIFSQVALIDMKMPGISGLELLISLKKINPYIQVIILTAFGTIETAVDCMKEGAFDFLTKPIENLDDLIEKINKATAQNRIVVDNQIMSDRLNETFPEMDIIGKSKAINQIKELITTVSGKNTTILISGPSGTGKELVARAIHSLSDRAANKMVAVNCAAFPENLLESELFGYEKGAFTGADKLKLGRFELADGGSLFLDEIGELPLSVQVKLLRVLEDRKIERLGGTSEIEIDFRLITATNRNLKQMIAEKKFREDLYYRLNVIEIELPSLIERGGDILILARHFIEKYKRKFGKEVTGLSGESAALLSGYDWPGNVRELENVIERAMVLTTSNQIEVSDLPGLKSGGHSEWITSDANEPLADIEKKYINKALINNNWSISKTAEILGIHRNTLSSKIKEYNLSQ